MLAALAGESRLAQNLANVRTPGFLADGQVLGATPDLALLRVSRGREVPVGVLSTGVAVVRQYVDPTLGPIRYTGRMWDLALDGPGFFAVQTPAGVRYTRDGSFHVGPNGELLSSEGYPVLGVRGALAPGAGRVEVRADGTLWAGPTYLGTLAVYTFANPTALAKDQQGLLRPTGASGPARPSTTVRVIQGALVSSNVDVTRTMMEALSLLRAYEMDVAALQAQNATLDAAVNRVGKP